MAERMSEFETALLGQVNAIAVIGRAMLPRDRFDPEDLVQEVILRAWANRDRLRDPASLPTWVSTIARNTARDWIRRPEAVPSDSLPDTPAPVTTALDRAHDHERLRALLHALETLEPADRELLVARYRDDVPYSDLQARTGLSYAAVTSRVHRARQRVRRLLATAGAALAVLFAPRQRAFGQAATRTAGGSTALTFVVAVTTALVGGVGLGLHYAADPASAAAAPVMRLTDIPNARRTPALLGELIESIRRHEVMLDTYSATFRRTYNWLAHQREGPPQHIETLTEGTVLRSGAMMFASLTTTNWRTDGARRPAGQERVDVTSDGELAARRVYWESAPPTTYIELTRPDFEYDLLSRWLPTRGSFSDYLADCVQSGRTHVTAERFDAEGEALYRIVTLKYMGPRDEYLVDPAQGYRVISRVHTDGKTRTRTDVEHRQLGDDVWYPARVTYSMSDLTADSTQPPAWERYTLEITEFATAAIPDEAFAAVPARGNPFYDAIRALPNRGGVVKLRSAPQ